MKKHALASLIFITALLLFANQSAEVNTRPISSEDKALFFQRMEKESLKTNKVKTKAFFSTLPVIYLPEDGQYLIEASIQRKAVILDDCSVWRVNPTDLNKFPNWKAGDFLLITQNRNWFSHYNYRIINHSRQESMEAYLHEKPDINGKHSHSIFAMNFDNGKLVFKNNSVWELCQSDYSTYRNWAINDLIIVGINTGWQSDYTHILINIDTDSWVRAKLY